MIYHLLNELTNKSLVLASSSPRRIEILKNIGIQIQVIPSTFEENLNPANFSHPREFVKETARGKSNEVAERLLSSNQHFDLLIGADTCVTFDGQVYGKPRDKEHAVRMLKCMSGKVHEVITGVSLIEHGMSAGFSEVLFHETTSVKFASLPHDLIEAYVNTGEPLDKAGGYGIQGLGGALIESIEGDYFNVMGFPLHRFTQHLLPILEKWKS